MIYAPDIENYQCYVLYDKDTIRAYQYTPTYNSTINYRDYFINSHYVYRDGYQSFSQYSTIPTCLSSDVLTSNVYYRNDLDSIMIIFICIAIIGLYLPLKIFSKLFKKGGI